MKASESAESLALGQDYTGFTAQVRYRSPQRATQEAERDPAGPRSSAHQPAFRGDHMALALPPVLLPLTDSAESIWSRGPAPNQAPLVVLVLIKLP